MKDGWEILEFEKCLEKVTYTRKIKRKEFKEKGVFPVISQEQGEVNGYWDNEDDLFTVDRPVVIFGDHTQVLKYVDYSFVLGADGVKILKPKNDIDPRYFYYFLKNVDLGNLGYARHYRLLKEVNVFYPKYLPEQQRIVSILDKAFAAIDKAKANAEQNLKNAKELFESYLQGVFSEVFDSNERRTIKELAKVIGGYSFKSKDFKKEGQYQVIRMGNVRPGIIRENENPVFINDLDTKVLSRALLQPDDVIITQTGTKKKRDYGFTVIIEKDNYLLNQRIAAIRFDELYLPKFFLYFSWTDIFKDQYFANETGTVGQGNVGIKAITDAEVPFLSLEGQEQIIENIELIHSETQSLEAIYQKKMDDLEELKKSILQKAFAGELETEKAVAV